LRRLAITLEYDGTDFLGWQVQAEGRTVQGAVEEAVRRTTRENIRVTGASRTDAGVHAEGQVAHFDTASGLSAERIVPALNHYLPGDVSVLQCREVGGGFHAQFSAISKLYRYRILLSGPPRPLRERFVLREWRRPDAGAMAACAEKLLGEHDFTSFASEHSEVENKVRRITRSEVTADGDELHYMVEANGFLYNMVRVIVGTLLEVGRGKMTVEEFSEILPAQDRGVAGPTAPSRGLALLCVRYPDGGDDSSSAQVKEAE
jgi:tRNA pseudouridine38-40 synthase